MNLSYKWIKRALQHQGIKGEHAYLEAIKDVIKEINEVIEKNKYMSLKDFKLDTFNTNKKKK
jgi:hypothetical protein